MSSRILLASLLVLILAGCDTLVDQTVDQPTAAPTGPIYPSSMRNRPLPTPDRQLQDPGRYDRALSTPGTRYRNGGDVDRGEPSIK